MILVPRHALKSRQVTDADIERVLSDVEEMKKLFTRYTLALAHSQVDDKDPLAFFLTADWDIVINPVITNFTKHFTDSYEGCMTFPDKASIRKQRHHKVTVECQTIENGKLTERESVAASSQKSFMFQHEIDHINGIYCYDELRQN